MSDTLLKKGFDATKDVLEDLVAVVTLVRTLSESFGSASDLYRKLKKKSKNIKEDIKDRIKDDPREENEEHHRQHRHGRPRRDSSSSDERENRRLARWRSRSRSRRRDESRDSDGESIYGSSNLVRAEYDHGYHFLGEKFAVGDLITRNQLQYQIIVLQQSLLHIYEDIILNSGNPRHSPSFHLQQLVQTTRTARSAAIEALAMQYRRMLPPPDHRELHPHVPGAFPTTPIVRKPREAIGLPERPRKPSSGSLFCVYARDLQRSRSLPITDNFKPGGDSLCPYCHAHIPARLNKAWEIVKEDERDRDVHRTFLIGTRFLVKSHREGEGFACVLCTEFREADTVCLEARALVEHLWKEHTCKELEMDDNIGEEQ